MEYKDDNVNYEKSNLKNKTQKSCKTMNKRIDKIMVKGYMVM